MKKFVPPGGVQCLRKNTGFLIALSFEMEYKDIKQLLTPVLGLSVADTESVAKNRFTLCRMNRSCHPQLKEVYMSTKKKFVASLMRLNPAGSWSAGQKTVFAKAGMRSLLFTLTLMVAAFGVFPLEGYGQKDGLGPLHQ